MSGSMNWLIWSIFAFVAIAAALALYVRFAPNDVAEVHRDPVSEGASGQNMAVLAPPDAPVYDVTPERLFALLEGVVIDTPRVEKVAEGPDPLHASYISRTPLMGYPDYVSLRVISVEGGASFAIWSRSRFGRSDFGLNAARIERWREELENALGAS